MELRRLTTLIGLISSPLARPIELSFTGITGALHTRSNDRPSGFELRGEAEGSCRYAIGWVEGHRVMLAGDGQPVTRVRYAWADSPTVNLFDEAPLPAGPFEGGCGRSTPP